MNRSYPNTQRIHDGFNVITYWACHLSSSWLSVRQSRSLSIATWSFMKTPAPPISLCSIAKLPRGFIYLTITNRSDSLPRLCKHCVTFPWTVQTKYYVTSVPLSTMEFSTRRMCQYDSKGTQMQIGLEMWQIVDQHLNSCFLLEVEQSHRATRCNQR